jgi:hypothetical protein
MNPQPLSTELPWWRIGHVWLVVAGPALVVLASIYTAWIAVGGMEQELTGEGTRTPSSSLAKALDCSGLTPAIKGRNQAATDPVECHQNVIPLQQK